MRNVHRVMAPLIAASIALPASLAAQGAEGGERAALGGVAPQKEWIAVLGDSFSSGEAAPPYEAGTEVENGNGCHRGRNGWAWKIMAEFPGADLEFLACSGATVGENFAARVSHAEEPQVQRLKERVDEWGPPRAVLYSIGGNDVKFAPLITTCYVEGVVSNLVSPVSPGACWLMGEHVIDLIQTELPARLDNAYDKVIETLGAAAPETPVFVIGYPQVYKPNIGAYLLHCQWVKPHYLRGSSRSMESVAPRMNVQIQGFVENRRNRGAANLHYVNTLDVIAGHELCTGKAWIHSIVALVDLSPAIAAEYFKTVYLGTGDFRKIILKDSAHPIEPGQEAMARRIRGYVAYARLPRETDKGSQLVLGQTLLSGESLYSPNRKFRLLMQADGNLVLYRSDQEQALWSTGTDGWDQGGLGDWLDGPVILQDDGNLVHYDVEGRARWASKTVGVGRVLRLQDDGNLVLYGASGPTDFRSDTVQNDLPVNTFPSDPPPPMKPPGIPPAQPEAAPVPPGAPPAPPGVGKPEETLEFTLQVDRYSPKTSRDARIVASLDDDHLLDYREDRPLWGKSQSQFVTVRLKAPVSEERLLKAINRQTRREIGVVQTFARLEKAQKNRSYVVAWLLGPGATTEEPWGKNHDVPQVFVAR